MHKNFLKIGRIVSKISVDRETHTDSIGGGGVSGWGTMASAEHEPITEV